MQNGVSYLKADAIKRIIKIMIPQRIIAFFALLISPILAFAQASESPVGQGLSYVINSLVYGTDGVVIATIAVAGIGICCLKHVFDWKVFFYVIAGIAIVFGAPAIVQGIKSLVTV